MKRTGRCLCGKITWETSADTLWSGHCHCDSCRRASAAPFTSFFGVPRDSVIWTRMPAHYTSSPGVRRGYCPDCGSQLFYQNEIWPNETHLYAATLDDPTVFVAGAHYHWLEKLPWINISDDLPKYANTSDNQEPIKAP